MSCLSEVRENTKKTIALLLIFILDRKVCTNVPERRSQAEESSVHQYTFIMISRKERMLPGSRNRHQLMYTITDFINLSLALTHGLINYKDTKSKCRLYWCLIEFKDRRYSQSCWCDGPPTDKHLPQSPFTGKIF
jgi:hypothetical protein